MDESRNAYRVLVGRPEGKRPLGRPRRRWEDNITMDLREVEYDDREWINLAQDRDQWRAYVRAAMNLRLLPASRSIAAPDGWRGWGENGGARQPVNTDCCLSTVYFILILNKRYTEQSSMHLTRVRSVQLQDGEQGVCLLIS
ncbi:hypothetical protein ANN_09019 [Periplaneta americana]|uniref:Uncharacterized protein n=1 Tax=Periplaneta americana TaxID=6978 RepID=A0ABQ8TM92_PERAM|nr:hypothetical protein ANN_09019 [Periplaneta americana]